MHSFLISCLASVVIAVGAAVVLNNAMQKSAESAFVSTAVRI